MAEVTDNIIELNRDVETLIIANASSRTPAFKTKFDDKYAPLKFVHCSDVHARLDMWNRLVEYTNHYSEYIDFIIHTGDFCGSFQEQYADFYNDGIKSVHKIYTCVGNHDTVTTDKWIRNTKESVYKLVFEPADLSGLTFLDCDFSMTYYKDFPESNIRMIVMDLYHDIELQKKWLEDVLEDARAKGLFVITAMHEPSADVNDSFGVTFHTHNDYTSLVGKMETQPFEAPIAEFIAKGGCHICNFVGHTHHDLFGFTDAGVLNTAVPCGTFWDGWCDGRRIPGTRSADCFNVVCIDPNMGLLKIVRVGNNRDCFLRSQRSLCYDYINKKVIFND